MIAGKERRRQACALCGGEIEGPGIRESFGGREKLFCSEGCARAYRDMHQQQEAEIGAGHAAAKRSGLTLILSPSETGPAHLRRLVAAGQPAA